MNNTALIAFFAACNSVKSESDALVFLRQWEGAACDESWWVATGAPLVRVSTMRATAFGLYLAAKANAAVVKGESVKGEKANAAPRERKTSRFVAVIGPQGEKHELSKGFDKHWDCLQWANRVLADRGAGGWVAVIRETGRPDTVIERDDAIALVRGGERKVSAAMTEERDTSVAVVAEDATFERVRAGRAIPVLPRMNPKGDSFKFSRG